MHRFKRRGNGLGCAVYLGDNRQKPWSARISIGKDENGKYIYHHINSFHTELEALVCLENYHKDPYPIYIKNDKYNRIATFPQKPYPIVPVANPHNEVIEKIKKDTYTFRQLWEDFEKVKIPTKEEQRYCKLNHVKINGKYGFFYARGMINSYHTCKPLYDKVYKDLRTSDFMNFLNECGKNYSTKRLIVNLFKKLDEYALQEDIIDKSYAQHITLTNTNESSKNARTPFTYPQIEYLWNVNAEDFREDFVRDVLLLTIYTGCRAEELLFTYTKNVFLDKDYFITGLKTKAGINREIPIHPKIKPLIQKYYNVEHEFLFHMPDSKIAGGRRANYDYYAYHYKNNFIDKHPFLEHHTAHEGRHTLRTELEKLNVKQVIINAIIGHSNENVGQDTYTHISIEEKLKAIKLVTYKEGTKLHILKAN